jgi:predicted nuclease of predicted toxin-antitoxin system
MKLLVDMNLSPRWISFLAAARFDAVHWSTVGPVNATDTEIMAYAREHGYVVLTNDLDFSAILSATHGTGPSVVQIRSDDLNPNTIGPLVVNAVNQLAVQLQSGALVSVEPHRAKVRVLPL